MFGNFPGASARDECEINVSAGVWGSGMQLTSALWQLQAAENPSLERRVSTCMPQRQSLGFLNKDPRNQICSTKVDSATRSNLYQIMNFLNLCQWISARGAKVTDCHPKRVKRGKVTVSSRTTAYLSYISHKIQIWKAQMGVSIPHLNFWQLNLYIVT